jgi:hypothetical protein
VAALYLGSALNPINSTVIATTLVPIAHFMHVSVGRTSIRSDAEVTRPQAQTRVYTGAVSMYPDSVHVSRR